MEIDICVYLKDPASEELRFSLSMSDEQLFPAPQTMTNPIIKKVRDAILEETLNYIHNNYPTMKPSALNLLQQCRLQDRTLYVCDYPV